jgi:photosystem II stability/assembly factor-like uncharacterized protein
VVAAGVAVRGGQLGGIDFLTGSTGVGITDPQLECFIPLGPRQGVQVDTVPQTVRLVVSEDGGQTWLTQGAAVPMSGTGLVQLAAASASQVWAASPSSGRLFGTSNGGQSWQLQLPGVHVTLLASGNRAVWAISQFCRFGVSCPTRLFLARAPGWQWHAVPLPRRLSRWQGLRLDGASVPTPVLLALANRQRGWRQLCTDGGFLAAVPGGDLLMLCSEPLGMGHARNFLYRSADDGRSWRLVAADKPDEAAEPARALPAVDVNALAALSDRLLVFVNDNGLWISTDAGSRWRQVPGVQLGGIALAQVDGPIGRRAWLLGWMGEYWRTTDGVHWRR